MWHMARKKEKDVLRARKQGTADKDQGWEDIIHKSQLKEFPEDKARAIWTAAMENSGDFLKSWNLNCHMTQQSHFWAYTPRKLYLEWDTCTQVFIEALFIIARTWKQPRCPSADTWIRKLWYIYTMEYYSAIKKNSFESVLMRWMKLEPIIQSEESQKDKDQYSILTHICGI